LAGGPLKPAFGLSRDVQISPNSVIPTGTDHRKAMICRVEGPAVAASPDCEEHCRSSRNKRHENPRKPRRIHTHANSTFVVLSAKLIRAILKNPRTSTSLIPEMGTQAAPKCPEKHRLRPASQNGNVPPNLHHLGIFPQPVWSGRKPARTIQRAEASKTWMSAALQSCLGLFAKALAA